VRPPEADALLARLASREPAEILGRIADGDPLQLYPLCAHRIQERYFVLDADRVHERALAFVATAVGVEIDAIARPDWLISIIDRAIESRLNEDREEERAGKVPCEPTDQRYRIFVESFGTEPTLARAAAVRFNGLEERNRRGFFHLLIYGEAIETCLEKGMGPPDDLRNDILTALWALGHLDDQELDQMKAGKRA
jgi:hypothetical protein